MEIFKKVKTDLTSAIKQKDDKRKSILRVLIGEFNRVDKEVDDNMATSIIKKMVQNAIDMNNVYEKNVLREYLPQQLSEEELTNIIQTFISKQGLEDIKCMGKVMTFLKENHNGQYDGKLASQIIKKIFS